MVKGGPGAIRRAITVARGNPIASGPDCKDGATNGSTTQSECMTSSGLLIVFFFNTANY